MKHGTFISSAMLNGIPEPFLVLLKLSLVTSIMALIVLGIRFCLRKAPKVYTYVLWIFVFIRAALPISYSSAYSLWNILKLAFSPQYSTEPSFHTAAVSVLPADSVMYAHSAASSATVMQAGNTSASAMTHMPSIWILTVGIWILGVSAMLLYSIYSMQKLRKTVKFATLSKTAYTPANCRVYESDEIKTAFILGFFHPAIYLPKRLTESQKRLILEHESVHICRHDHQIKLAAWLILALHWFNPLMWISFQFLNKDMELSCDEQVLIHLGSQVRADYSSLLLDLAAPNRISSGIPLAFSEGNTKIRIKNILNYRPVKFGSAAAAILLIFITVYGCMGNPEKEPDSTAKETEAEIEKETAITPEEKEELAFVQNFVNNLIDCHGEEIYAALSPELKEREDTFCGAGKGLWLETPGRHIRINPFDPTDAPVIEKTSTGYRYQMKRPEYPPPPEYQDFHSTDVLEGTLAIEKTDSGLTVTEWEEYGYNEIASQEEFEWNYQYYSFSDDAQAELDWIESHPEEASELFYYDNTNAEEILTNRFHLINGKVTDIQKDEQNGLKHITYSWEDGSVVFRMEQLLDQLWFITDVES